MPSIEACTQPECLLREANVDRRSLAELVVGVLAGKETTALLGGGVPIDPHMRCVECVLGVFAGGRPLPSVAQVERLLAAGHASHRRLRRRARREERTALC